MAQLTSEQIVTIRVLLDKGQSASQIARLLDITEGAIRYHRRRAQANASDGRHKSFRVQELGLVPVIEHWWQAQSQLLGSARPPSVQALYEFLVAEHGYDGSYKSVRVFARHKFGLPPRRPFRRVETPPGAQAQSDWSFFPAVDLGDPDGPVTVYGFFMVLSHSRKEALIWSRRMDQLAWHRVHNEAFRRLKGVPAVNRIDNLKTGIVAGSGPWGVINPQYLSYARTLGFHIDACEAFQPQQKGKTERRVGVFKRLGPLSQAYAGIEDLQSWTDQRLEVDAARRICPATGRSVAESWEAEQSWLRPLPALLPEPFDLVRTAKVHKDCSVRFEGRSYIVPFAYLGRELEVRGCSGVVQAIDPTTGLVLVEYPRHTKERILINQSCYEGAATADVAAPAPLGRMGRRLQEIGELPVERRPIDLYAALAEAAR